MRKTQEPKSPIADDLIDKDEKILVKIVGYDLVNVREGPSLRAGVVFRARKGDEYLVESLGFAWVRVYDKKSQEPVGYVMRELLEEVVKNG